MTKIEQLYIAFNTGFFARCESNFYVSHSGAANCDYHFAPGVNRIVGDIDSDGWAISYLMSMYKFKEKSFVMYESPIIQINNTDSDIRTVADYSCYMDMSYPLFKSKSTVSKLIDKGLKNIHSEISASDIRDLFKLDKNRFDRSLTGVGNEIFRAMSAIAYSYGKQVFCFPWLSRSRFDYYHENLTETISTLSKLGMIVILPTSKS